MVHTFDPKLVSLIFGGKIISGYADGTFILVERNEQTFNLKVGADGEGTRVKSNNKSGKITVTLMQSSASNDDLSAFALADEISNTGVVPVLMKDGSGRTVVSGATAWLQKPANVELAKEATARTWVIESDELAMVVGGN